jgi:hypothetical protein
MEPEASLLYSLEPIIGSLQSHFNPDYALMHYLRYIFTLDFLFHLCLYLPIGLFSLYY